MEEEGGGGLGEGVAASGGGCCGSMVAMVLLSRALCAGGWVGVGVHVKGNAWAGFVFSAMMPPPPHRPEDGAPPSGPMRSIDGTRGRRREQNKKRGWENGAPATMQRAGTLVRAGEGQVCLASPASGAKPLCALPPRPISGPVAHPR